jgi:hypothetical protein
MMWTKDPIAWRKLLLTDKLDALIKHYCRGPCGQSHSVLSTRSTTETVLRQAISELRKRDDDAE